MSAAEVTPGVTYEQLREVLDASVRRAREALAADRQQRETEVPMELDPDETLAQMRSAQERVRERYEWADAHEGDVGFDYAPIDQNNADDRETIADCAERLDDWLSAGGRLPTAWAKER